MTIRDSVDRAGYWAERIVKIAAAASLIFGGIGFAAFNPMMQAKAQAWLGITANNEAIGRNGGRLDTIEKRLPGPQIALYDPTYSEIIGACHIGSICVARFRVKRTPYGSECDKPSVTPYVRNHGAVRHPAEFISGAIRADSDWEFIEIRFLAPTNAKPGRAVYWSDQDYLCPFGSADQRSDLVPFLLLPKRE